MTQSNMGRVVYAKEAHRIIHSAGDPHTARQWLGAYLTYIAKFVMTIMYNLT